MLCWNDESISLSNCIISTTRYSVSNASSHLVRQHDRSIIPELYASSDISSVTQSLADKGSVMVQSTIRPQQLQFKPNGTPIIALSHLYAFFNEASVAIEQASNVHLTTFISYLIDNADSLRTKKVECFFSRWKYKKQELSQFFTFISTVKYLVNFTRDYYKNQLQSDQSIPFISVSHDGWDSKDNDVLGVSIHFVVPKHWKMVSVAIGLKRINSKTSENIVRAIFNILLRYILLHLFINYNKLILT
jgi:hypothetical protein